MDDFFAELNKTIQATLAVTDKRRAAAQAKARANNKNASTEQRRASLDEHRLLIQEIEMEAWRPSGTVALFTEQQCDGCGSIHRVFLQFMEEQRHVNPVKGRRSLRVMQPNMALPLSTMIQAHTTHMCADCCEDHGFAVIGAMMLSIAGDQPLAVSSTYIQGDINGGDGE